MNDIITFKKSDMIFITDDELTTIKVALDRYRYHISKSQLI